MTPSVSPDRPSWMIYMQNLLGARFWRHHLLIIILKVRHLYVPGKTKVQSEAKMDVKQDLKVVVENLVSFDTSIVGVEDWGRVGWVINTPPHHTPYPQLHPWFMSNVLRSWQCKCISKYSLRGYFVIEHVHNNTEGHCHPLGDISCCDREVIVVYSHYQGALKIISRANGNEKAQNPCKVTYILHSR